MAKNEDQDALPSEVGYVYVASTNTYYQRGIYKVGMTDDIPRRLKDLSSTSGVAEPFFDVVFFRTPSIDEAKRLESEVHKRLDSAGARLQSNREFFRAGTYIGIALCIRKCAKDFGIDLVDNTTCHVESIVKNDDAPVMLIQNLQVLPSQLKRLYLRGARDFVSLMLIWRATEKEHPVPVFFNDISLDLQGYSLDPTQSLSLFSTIQQKISLHYGRKEAEKFGEQFRLHMDEWLNDRLPGEDLENWKDFIDTNPNWPNSKNN
jgi:hypothetical protein